MSQSRGKPTTKPESRRASASRDLESWPPPAPSKDAPGLALPPLPNKLFFRIGEVAELVGVRPHVLRYWEQELGLLRPMKTRGAHRQYRRRDVEVARMVRQLTEIEGYTVAGAKKRLAELRGTARAAPPGLSRELTAIREELVAAATLLEARPRPRVSIEPADARIEPVETR